MRRDKPSEKKKLRKRRAAAGASTEDEPDAPEPSGRGRVRVYTAGQSMQLTSDGNSSWGHEGYLHCCAAVCCAATVVDQLQFYLQ